MKKIIRIDKPDPSKIKFIDFNVEKEPWNKYRVKDGSNLKARFILQQIITDKSMEKLENELKKIKPDEHVDLGFGFKGNRLFSADAPLKLCGLPDEKKYLVGELRESIIDEDIDFDTVNSSWNIYHLENGMTFKCRVLVQTVNRTDKFDELGLPIYFIESNLDVKVDLPSNIEKIIKDREKLLRNKRKIPS